MRSMLKETTSLSRTIAYVRLVNYVIKIFCFWAHRYGLFPAAKIAHFLHMTPPGVGYEWNGERGLLMRRGMCGELFTCLRSSPKCQNFQGGVTVTSPYTLPSGGTLVVN